MPFFTLLIIALMIVALVDIIRRDDSQVRFLPKMVWLILVVLLPLIGSILWFALGRQYESEGISLPRMRTRRAPRTAPSFSAPPLPPQETRTTEEQIADLDREIEEWRLRAEIEKRRQQDAGEV